MNKRWYQQFYVWVLTAIIAGGFVGWRWPGLGAELQPLGDTFVHALKMVIGPVVFLTIVSGIAGVASLRGLGRVGVKLLIYFNLMALVALGLGMFAANFFRPGAGIHANPDSIKVSGNAEKLIDAGEHQSAWQFLSDIVPSSMLSPFTEGNILQVVFISILFGVALKAVGPIGEPVADGIDRLSTVILKLLNYVMYAAPVGAFGAMAYSIGAFGIDTLFGLGKLIGVFYGTSLFFIFIVLGGVAAYLRLNIFSLLGYFREELLVALGTASSDSVLARLLAKIERVGVPKDIVGIAVPTGYTFNMDGGAIYLSLATIFIAQATDTPLSIGMQLALLGIMLLTLKGSAGVAGSGFIVLAATLSSFGPVPAAGIMLIFGIDKFMSECRVGTNVCGNIVASFVIARWEGRLDSAAVRKTLSHRKAEERVEVPEPQTMSLISQVQP